MHVALLSPDHASSPANRKRPLPARRLNSRAGAPWSAVNWWARQRSLPRRRGPVKMVNVSINQLEDQEHEIDSTIRGWLKLIPWMVLPLRCWWVASAAGPRSAPWRDRVPRRPWARPPIIRTASATTQVQKNDLYSFCQLKLWHIDSVFSYKTDGKGRGLPDSFPCPHLRRLLSVLLCKNNSNFPSKKHLPIHMVFSISSILRIKVLDKPKSSRIPEI